MAELAKVLGDVKVRYDWYQTETHVILNVLHRNIDASLLKVDCTPQSVTIHLPGVAEPFVVQLSHEVRPNDVQKKVSSAKLEVRLLKVEGLHWTKLEGEDHIGKPIPKEESSGVNPPSKAKNWDEVVKNEQVDDEDALNSLFKKIYSEGSEEVQRAMNKSFMESGGTVLSTNWKEVQTEKVDIKPPEGMEFKKWDS